MGPGPGPAPGRQTPPQLSAGFSNTLAWRRLFRATQHLPHSPCPSLRLLLAVALTADVHASNRQPIHHSCNRLPPRFCYRQLLSSRLSRSPARASFGISRVQEKSPSFSLRPSSYEPSSCNLTSIPRLKRHIQQPVGLWQRLWVAEEGGKVALGWATARRHFSTRFDRAPS